VIKGKRCEFRSHESLTSLTNMPVLELSTNVKVGALSFLTNTIMIILTQTQDH
jgi:hypothetical protein